jgi:hypothetical protein
MNSASRSRLLGTLPRMLPASLVLLAALGSACVAADTTTPAVPKDAPSAPGQVDPVTARRAEKAADAYLAQQDAARSPADPESATLLADSEVLLLEAKTLLDDGKAKDAGARYVAAAAKLAKIGEDQRAKLGERFRKASTALLALSRALLATDAVDPASAPGAGTDAPLPAQPEGPSPDSAKP